MKYFAILLFALVALAGLCYADCKWDQADYNECKGNCKINANDQFCDNLKCQAYCYNQQGCVNDYKQECLLAQATQPSCDVDCNSGMANAPMFLMSIAAFFAAYWVARR